MTPTDLYCRLAAALILLGTGGCGGGGNGADGEQRAGSNIASSDRVDVLPPDESVATPTNDLAEGVIDTPPADYAIAPNPDAAIPAALHGRWGLTAADCESGRNDAKGLATIAADRVTFYESVAVPRTIRDTTRTTIDADFAFTGEGMSWNVPIRWAVEGRQLVRTDGERGTRLVYTRCPPGDAGLR